MEVIRMVKLHIPVEGDGGEEIVNRFRELSIKYGRKIDIDEISRIIEERFTEGD